MRATDMWRPGSKPTVSFEVFPARTPKSAESFERALEGLVALKPDFFSVTFGAGGSTREGSRQLIEKLKKDRHAEVIAYFACYGLGPDDIKRVLDSYQELGLENVLAVRGDAPKDQEGFKPHAQHLPHASDLVAFIRSQYRFCIGAAGYPEGHAECESREKDLEYLKRKVDNGAEYIIANYFYDNRFFFDFVDRCTAAGIRVPILPGIMPVYSVKMLGMLAGLCGATITDELRNGLASLPEGDKEAVLSFGIEFAIGKCKELLQAGVPGLHIYTMDRAKSTTAIVNSLRAKGLL